MSRLTKLLVAAAVLTLIGAAADSGQVEMFDTSGMPRRPTTFVEQQIFEMIGAHKPGNLADAVIIQRKLGRYYADKGDEARANAAFLRAAAGEEKPAAPPSRPPGFQSPMNTGKPAPPAPVPAANAKLAGNYYGYDGRTLHTWDFAADATFLHTWIVSGAGTGVRNSERGRYEVMGNTVELRIGSTATGFTTPGVGGRSTLSGGGADASTEVRRLKIQFLPEERSIVLDGARLKPKSW